MILSRCFYLSLLSALLLVAASVSRAAPIPNGRYKAACECAPDYRINDPRERDNPPLPPLPPPSSPIAPLEPFEGSESISYFDDSFVEDAFGALAVDQADHLATLWSGHWSLHNEIELIFGIAPKFFLRRHHRLLSPFELFILSGLRAARHPGAGYATKDEADKILEDIWAIRSVRDLPACRAYKTGILYPLWGESDFTNIDVEDETQFLVNTRGELSAIRVEVWQAPEEFPEDEKPNFHVDPEACFVIDSQVDPQTKKVSRYKPTFPPVRDSASVDTDPVLIEEDDYLVWAEDLLAPEQLNPPEVEELLFEEDPILLQEEADAADEGCTDPEAENYDPNAEIDDSSCTYLLYGCTDPAAKNYDERVVFDDGTCEYWDSYCLCRCADGEITPTPESGWTTYTIADVFTQDQCLAHNDGPCYGWTTLYLENSYEETYYPASGTQSCDWIVPEGPDYFDPGPFDADSSLGMLGR